MPQKDTVNRRIVLAARPRGVPTLQDFRLEEAPVPTPDEGQVLLRTLYLSLDPYMRNLMDEIGPTYARSVDLGEPMVGGTVNRVVGSRHPQFRAGDLVLGNAGWQDYALSDGKDLLPLGEMERPSLALGGARHASVHRLRRPARYRQTEARRNSGRGRGHRCGRRGRRATRRSSRGARVVGIAGGADKCRYAVEELGFDVCLDRHDPQLAEHLIAACPNGIDVYFENVGGEVFDAVLPLLNIGARVPVCGFIAHYNDEALPAGPNRLPLLLSMVLQKRVHMQGFIILDHYADRFEAFRRDMGEWVRAGRVKVREHVIDGLENAPAAFMGLLEGRNFGKLVVRVGD